VSSEAIFRHLSRQFRCAEFGLVAAVFYARSAMSNTNFERRATRFYLVRHGAVAAPWHERIYGSLDVPLSDRGKEQSRRVAELLSAVELDLVVSSDLERAVFAAKLVAADPKRERFEDRRLREIDRGDWAGLGQAEVDSIRPGAWEHFWRCEGVSVPPGGERFADLQRRVTSALDDWHGRYPGAHIAVVAHKWVVLAATCASLGVPVERSPRLAMPHASVVVLDWAPNGGVESPAKLRAFGVDALPLGVV